MGAKTGSHPGLPKMQGQLGVLSDFPLVDMSFILFASPTIQGTLQQLVNISKNISLIL
jgi:hypothetical protein